MTDLNGKLALITGASRGIGRATAYAMAAKGARVILLARTESQLNEVAQTIRDRGGEAHTYVCDVTDITQVRATTGQIKADLGVPDVLVNNAGGGRWLSIEETSMEEAVDIMAAPYFAAFYITRAFIDEMLARDSGHIMNICSVASRMLIPHTVAYTATRWAVEGYTRALRADLYGTNIKVSMYTSGGVLTSYWEDNPESNQKADLIGGVSEKTPFILTEDQAAAAIVRGVERNQRVVVVPFGMAVAYRLYPVFGFLWDWVVTRRARTR